MEYILSYCVSRPVLTYVQIKVSLSFYDHPRDFTVDTIITEHVHVRESHLKIILLIIYISSSQTHK